MVGGGGTAISQVIDRPRCCCVSSWGRVCRTRPQLGCGVVVAASQGGRPRRSLATARPHGWWWWVESGTLPQVICGQVAQVTHISHSNIFQIFTGNNSLFTNLYKSQTLFENKVSSKTNHKFCLKIRCRQKKSLRNPSS